MKIKKQGFPSILLDNDANYISLLTDAILAHADPESEVKLYKTDNTMKVVIKPSQKDFKQSIITDLVAAHKLVKMKVVFSSSLAIQEHICYTIEF